MRHSFTAPVLAGILLVLSGFGDPRAAVAADEAAEPQIRLLRAEIKLLRDRVAALEAENAALRSELAQGKAGAVGINAGARAATTQPATIEATATWRTDYGLFKSMVEGKWQEMEEKAGDETTAQREARHRKFYDWAMVTYVGAAVEWQGVVQNVRLERMWGSDLTRVVIDCRIEGSGSASATFTGLATDIPVGQADRVSRGASVAIRTRVSGEALKRFLLGPTHYRRFRTDSSSLYSLETPLQVRLLPGKPPEH